MGFRNRVQYFLEAHDPTADFPPGVPERWIDSGHGIQPQQQCHERLVHSQLLEVVGAHGVHRVLPLDQALQPIGFGVDGGDFPVEGADAVGAVGGLDENGGAGWGIGWLLLWSVVIVVGGR